MQLEMRIVICTSHMASAHKPHVECGPMDLGQFHCCGEVYWTALGEHLKSLNQKSKQERNTTLKIAVFFYDLRGSILTFWK